MLPSIKESCLSSEEHLDIEATLKTYFGENYIRTLLLYQYSYAVHYDGNLYGSANSLHSSSSLVLANQTNNSTTADAIPGFVQKYITVDVLLRINGEQKQQKVHLALISWFSKHPYKDWFFCPVEVWCSISASVTLSSFIPISDIKCRCAYLVDLIVFNNELQENVTIVVPLNNFDGI